jgi:transcriptional regulator with XRE-family HTH domain
MPRINSKKVDAEIGRRIRELRALRGISSQTLGKKLGISFQALCKYERGAASISVATMLAVCSALKTETGYFLKGL